MVVKNLTFVVEDVNEHVLIAAIKQQLPFLADWCDEVSFFKLQEKVDPDSQNFALQLSFTGLSQLETFNNVVLDRVILDIQNVVPILYFESHLERIY